MVGERVLSFLQAHLSTQGVLIALIVLAFLGVLLLFSAARLPLRDYGVVAHYIGWAIFWVIAKLFQAARFGGAFLGRGMNLGLSQGGTQLKAHQDRRAVAKAAAHEGTEVNNDKTFLQSDTQTQPSPLRIAPSLETASPLGNGARIEPSLGPLATAPGIVTPKTTKLIAQVTPTMQPTASPAIPVASKPVTPKAESSPAPSARHVHAADFQLPPRDLLNNQLPTVVDSADSHEKLQNNARRLEEVLGDFGIHGEIQRIKLGPVVTMYELEPAPGIKTSKIVNLSDDIARTMRALSVRIATIPGNSALGIELPNDHREMVNMKEILSAKTYQEHAAKLPMILGKTIDGTPLIVDLATMPHLLIAGTTGSGKSVGLNVMLLSILYRLNPDQCRIIMIDPKMLEFSVYDGIPHLLTPVVTEPRQAVVALKWTVREMENRYRLMSRVGVRNIDGYNARVADALSKGETLSRKVQTGINDETGRPTFDTEELLTEPLPLIVVVVDEMADLMIVAGKDIEASIQRLAQMARAAGIHLIMATQRPSVDVITGTIKANFPTRISYRVTSKIDSRTIIGEQGAEQLLGKGDLLLMQAAGNITRVHAPFVEDTEVERICNWLRAQRPPSYLEEVTDEGAINSDLGDAAAAMFETRENSDASLYDQAVAIVARHQKASTSFVQRQLRIGYNRAADLIDEMEAQGVISAANHNNKREVLIRGFDE
ncbi:MAG: DUF87 domain-containing protein [Alphaproteobacteria bacterium]|nr:DUF87 domain-containing protein [Alphaproteobacteria bacterium]